MREQKYRPRETASDVRSPLPLVGWALVVGSLISYSYLLFPLKLLDADWEFATMGPLVDNSLLCLLGMGLVFYNRQQVLILQHLIAMRALLVVGCIVSMVYLAMIPLAVSNERRLEEKMNSQYVQTQASYAERWEKIEDTLKRVKSIPDLKSVCSMLNLTPSPEDRKLLRLDDDYDQLRKWTERQIRAGLFEQKEEAMRQHERRLARLQKDGLRIIAGAGLAAVCYLLLCSMNFDLFREHVTDPENPRREN